MAKNETHAPVGGHPAPIQETKAPNGDPKAAEILKEVERLNKLVSTRTGSNYMPEDKFSLPEFEAKERFGVFGQPFAATNVWWAPIENFSRKDVVAEKWILVNDKAGTMSFVNTFDGFAGGNFKIDVATFPLDPKRLRVKIAGHTQVPIERCPVCVTVAEGGEHDIKTPEARPSWAGSAPVGSH